VASQRQLCRPTDDGGPNNDQQLEMRIGRGLSFPDCRDRLNEKPNYGNYIA